MDTRREFLKKAALLAGSAGLGSGLSASIEKAWAIAPAPGSTYLDAEHVVILMQENRSFDHCYGALRGVRGFNDPRAITLPNKNRVWLQTNRAGQTFAPFRLNLHDTKATWMSSLPHSWTNQVDARNEGKYDRWLDVKPSGHREYAHMPLTLGYYDRQDIPFYYALARCVHGLRSELLLIAHGYNTQPVIPLEWYHSGRCHRTGPRAQRRTGLRQAGRLDNLSRTTGINGHWVAGVSK